MVFTHCLVLPSSPNRGLRHTFILLERALRIILLPASTAPERVRPRSARTLLSLTWRHFHLIPRAEGPWPLLHSRASL